MMSKVKGWTLAFPQHSSEWHQWSVLDWSWWTKQRRPQPGFPLLFHNDPFLSILGKCPFASSECWQGAWAAQNPEALGVHRAWATCVTWHLSSFFLGWKELRSMDCHIHLFGSLKISENLLSVGFETPTWRWLLVSPPADAVSVVKYSSA